jgi:peptide chain release factor
MPLLSASALRRLNALGLHSDDFREHFHRSSGPGGQNVNKVETGVTLVHEPTGEAVRVEDTRSRQRNRELALERLLDRLEARRREKILSQRAEAAKRRRQAARRSASSKAKIRVQKVRRGQIKKLRKSPPTE